jgi:hypothetical protein
VKHRCRAKSIKLYDKAYDELGAVLRSEITITDTHLFRTYRPPLSDPGAAPRWLVMGHSFTTDWRPARHNSAAVPPRSAASCACCAPTA